MLTVPGRYQFSLPERPARDGWTRVGQLDLTTTAIFVIAGALSMVLYAINSSTAAKLAFIPPFVRDGDLWRLFTWPVFNPPTQIWVVLTLVFFWFVGHRVEELVGKRRMAILLLAMTVIPAIAVSLFRTTADTGFAAGLGMLGTGLLVVFVLEYPNATFFFNIPAWVIAAVIVGIDVLRYLGDRAYGMLLLELGVIVVAVVGARLAGLVTHLRFIPALPQRRAPAGRSRPSRGRAPGGAVVSGPWGHPPGPAASGSGSGDRVADQAALDRLLDKISASGMDSLSRSEKQELNELSKRLRER